MSSIKVKILLVGSIGDHVEDFVKKLTSLNKSKAGPFDACFCVGPVGAEIKAIQDIPIPVYLQDASGLVEDDSQEGLVELGPNLRVFASAQVVSIDICKTQLVAASCPPRVHWDSDSLKTFKDNLSHVSYVGCDLLLTSEWPQGIEGVLKLNENWGSYDVAEIALRARPRYHVAPAVVDGAFLQSPPFSHLASTSSTFTPKHVGRFLSLGPVLSPSEAKQADKTHKFVHALGLTPLQYMTANELAQSPAASILPCPYTDESYQKERLSSKNQNNVGLSEAQARRLIYENAAGGDSHTRWAESKRSRTANDETKDNTTDEVDPTNTTLFLHGLHKDARGMLQTGSVTLLEAFQHYQITRVRRPPAASSYAFLDFPSHELAKECLEKCGGEAVVAGIHLTLKWATKNPAPGGRNDRGEPPKKKRRLTEADAMDSSTLYFRLPPKVLSAEHAQSSEDLRALMEKTLEQALGDPDVTATTEPALQVKVRIAEVDKNFGFLEFASHAAASMAVATMTGNTDGGVVQEQGDESSQRPEIPSQLLGVSLYWAHDDKPPSEDTEGGLQFQRKHFPPDARKDCWFCLASPTCEKHLIVSVHDECYIAMPKGPVHEGHVLVIPVKHSSKGALVDPSIAAEMESLKTRLRRHASEKWDMNLFVFERAIQTKGGYHTHVQCIPIERGLGIKLQATMMGVARSIPNFQLRELNSDLALGAAIGCDDDGDSAGYFYAEVPFTSNEYKRFLYKSTGERAVVPLQFGREVLAQVLNNPDLAHWKGCVVDEAKETDMTTSFRSSFFSATF